MIRSSLVHEQSLSHRREPIQMVPLVFRQYGFHSINVPSNYDFSCGCQRQVV